MLGKRILLGISGGIAAYKIPILVRALKKQGAEVRCILTPSAVDFVSPLVLSTLSEQEVYIEFWDQKTGVWTNHVELALWADLMLLAPATANTLSKMANGACDNLLMATYLSLKCPCVVAPAMDLDMYKHPSLQRNLAQLQKDNVHIIPATFGALASGLEGQGRMEEPEKIADFITAYFQTTSPEPTKKKKYLITAGPTREPLDPVRYLSNHSTGQMGYAIARAALALGHEVVLISGPTLLSITHPNLRCVDIETAEELLLAVQKNWSWASHGIFSAAVADYRPKNAATQKIKKQALDDLLLELVKNPDVLAWAAAHKAEKVVMGFALETNNSEQNALKKLHAKNLDYIVLNEQQNGVSGFGATTNKITIFDKDEQRTDFTLQSKDSLATAIIQYLETTL